MQWLRQLVKLEALPELPSEPSTPTPPRLSVWSSWRSKIHRMPLLVTVGCLVVLIIGWLLAAEFLASVRIGTTQLSTRQNNAALSAALVDQTQHYQMRVSYPDGSQQKYPLTQVGLKLDSAASLRAIRQRQHQFGARLKWWQPIQAPLALTRDTSVLNTFVANHIDVTVQPSKDAVLSITGGHIQLTDAVTGKQYGLISPRHTLTALASTLNTSSLKLQTLTTHPALTTQILEPYKANLEKALNQPIHFTIGDTSVAPTPSDIANWLEITPDEKTKTVDIAVNSGKVQQYIDHVAATMIHPARAQVEMTAADGTSQVLVPGVNGVDVLNKNTVASAISKDLLKGSGFTESLPVSYQPFKTITAGDYDKWIEVDLTNKRMYSYEHATLVKTNLVSAGAPRTPTVTGQYAIYAKYDQQDMRGSNVDGSNYFQPHVRWVNYFYKDYAIHGNYWRPLSYFGNINSSHGCVGLVDSEAAWIYDWAPIGTPVIVHA